MTDAIALIFIIGLAILMASVMTSAILLSNGLDLFDLFLIPIWFGCYCVINYLWNKKEKEKVKK